MSCKHCGKSRREHRWSGLCKDSENFFDDGTLSESDLDRRERIAISALNGILSNPEWTLSEKDTAILALSFAEALIAELDKKNEDV